MTLDAPVAFDQAVPLQHQIYLHLHREITDGVWWGRTDFPGDKELARVFGVSVITVRAALDRLAEEGLVERRRGRGTRALGSARTARPEWTPSLLPVGPRRDYHYELLSVVEDTAPLGACEAFGLSPGSVLWQCTRLRSFEGRPHSVAHNVQLPELGRRHSRRALQSLPMAAILEQAGVQGARIRRRFGVTHPSPLEAERLGVTIADPVLRAEFDLGAEDGSVIEWVRILLHPAQETPDETMDLRTGTWSASEPL